MASQTADEIIKASLILLNVKEAGENLSASEAADGLVALNELIEEMNLQPYMQVAKVQLTQALSSGDGSYTFGTGGDNSIRPLVIHTAYIVDSTGNTSYPVNIISNQEYSYIPIKTLTAGYPFNLYYRNSYPLSTAELWPVPSSNTLTLFLECRAAISSVATGATVVDLPPGYIKYLKNQLAIDISPAYKEPTPVIYQNAAKSMEWIKRNNNKDKPFMQNTARQATRSINSGYFVGGV